MTLHIILSPSAWPCPMTTEDAVLLAGDGVYLLPQLETVPLLYVRTSDLQQRGLSNLPPNAILIDDAHWVQLTLDHTTVVSWNQ